MALPLTRYPCHLGNVNKPFVFRLNHHKSGLVDLARNNRRRFTVMVGESSCPFKFPDEPIVKEALKEPVAFLGGMFAGLLRLDLNEDPLKEWVSRTAEASGLTEDIDAEASTPEEEVPQQIEIE